MADVVAKIKLENGARLSIGKSFISSLKTSRESTNEAGSVFYGTLANSGSIEIQDGNQYISNMIDDGSLPVSSLDVIIDVNNERFQHHITTDGNYNTDENVLSISLSNFVKDFDILKYKGFVYPEKPVSLYELFVDVLNSYLKTTKSQIDAMFTDDILNYIKNIMIEYVSIEYGKTYRQVLDELCTIAQLNMYVDRFNLIHFISSRPIYSNSESIVKINWGDIVTDLKYSKPLKNKFDGVEISKTNVIDKIDYSVVVNTSKGDVSSYAFSGYIGTNPTLFDASYGVGGKIEAFYSSGEYSFKLKSDDKFKSILEILTQSTADSSGYYNIQLRNDELPYSVTYNKSYGKLKNEAQALIDIQRDSGSAPYPDPPYTNSVFLRTNYSGNVSFNEPSDSYSGKIPISFTPFTYNEISLPDNSWIKVKVNKSTEIVDVKYNLLTQCVFYNLSTNRFNNFRTDTEITKYNAVNYNISIYGDERNISFENVPASTDGIEEAQTKASVNSGRLLQNTTTYNSREIVDIIKENILNDFKKGISSGEFIMNKDTVDIGDLLKYPNDKRVWRVVGKGFNYDGEYLFPVSVVQCRIPDAEFGVFDEDGETLYSWDELVEKGLLIVDGDTLEDVNVDVEGVLKIKDGIKNFGFRILGDSPNITKLENYGGLKTLSNSCLAYSKGLLEFDTGNNITTIEQGALQYCDNLKKIIIGKNVTEIGSVAFRNNPSLELVSYGPTNFTNPNKVYDFFTNSGSNSGGLKIVVEERVQVIPYELFSARNGENYITNIEIKSTVLKTIGENAFAGTKIKEINLPKSLTEIGRNAFENSTIKTIELPDNVSTIGTYAFRNCSSLEYVKLPSSITKLEIGLFYGCISLKELIIPDGVTEIGSSLLSGCNSIEKLELPSIYLGENLRFKLVSIFDSLGSVPLSLKNVIVKAGSSSTIQYKCFENCSGIEEVTIKAGINYIENNAFEGCSGLKRVVFEDTVGWNIWGRAVDVTDPEQNAIMLTETYMRDSWQK